MSGEGSSGGEDSRRVPRNMQALLNFCTELTADEDPTGPSPMTEMNPERRAFLENVFASLHENVPQKMVLCLQTLSSDSVTIPGDSIEEQADALSELAEYVDDIDHAKDLHKVGGFPVVIHCLNSPHSVLREKSAALIGDLCQNNDYCQEKMEELKVLPLLLSMVDSDTEEPTVRVKALYAVSCYVRAYHDGQKEFISLDGFSFLMRAVQSGIENLIVKSIFLLRSLVADNPDSIDTLISMGFIEQLVIVLQSDANSICREHVLSALLFMAESNSSALRECVKAGLAGNLNSRIGFIQDKEEFKEEEHYSRSLLQLLKAEDDDLSCR